MLALLRSSYFQIIHHYKRALLRGLCRRNQVTQIQLQHTWYNKVILKSYCHGEVNTCVTLNDTSYLGNHPVKICHYPILEQSAWGES